MSSSDRIGLTTLADPDRNFKIMTSAHLPGFGIYWYRRDAYLKRKAEFARTGDTKYLVRDVELQSPQFDAGLRAQLDKSLRPMAPLKPMAVYLADESSLTFYGDAFDVSFAPEALAGFRQWLQQEYPSLEALNASWDTSFKDWESVRPMTAAEAQKHGTYAPWADHRTYMESEFVRAFGKATALVHEMDPGRPRLDLRARKCRPRTMAATGTRWISKSTICSRTRTATRTRCITCSGPD